MTCNFNQKISVGCFPGTEVTEVTDDVDVDVTDFSVRWLGCFRHSLNKNTIELRKKMIETVIMQGTEVTDKASVSTHVC